MDTITRSETRRWTGRIVLFALAIGGISMALAGEPAADNTKVNSPDRSQSAVTAESQSNARRDLNLTADLRRKVVSDKSLSLYAHNVKIITVAGVITLRGPVKTADEITNIGDKAVAMVGKQNVKNELAVAP